MRAEASFTSKCAIAEAWHWQREGQSRTGRRARARARAGEGEGSGAGAPLGAQELGEAVHALLIQLLAHLAGAAECGGRHIISYQQRASEYVCATLPGLGGSKADAGRAGTWLASKLWEGQGGREQLSAALCMRT